MLRLYRSFLAGPKSVQILLTRMPQTNLAMMLSESSFLRRPTLRRRLIFQSMLIVALTALLSIAAVYGITRIHANGGAAISAHRAMRTAFEVGVHVSAASSGLNRSDLMAARSEITSARTKLAFEGLSTDAALANSLDEASVQLGAGDRNRASASLQRAKSAIADLVASCRVDAAARERLAARERTISCIFVASVAVIAIAGTIWLTRRQYRSVVCPIDRLATGLRDFTAGELSRRVDEVGDAEFVQLSRDFNVMARRLDELCADLTQQIETKSRELIRSERLAGIGLLAAGVAHEINNPLGIIAGFGERSLKKIRRGLDHGDQASLERSLAIICDEAFRCKHITNRLLDLARPRATSTRHVVSLAAIARDVIDSLAGFDVGRLPELCLSCATNDDVGVNVNEDEVKQVMLNLLLNAIAATRDRSDGRIHVAISRMDDVVQLEVHDNGVGMSPHTLERVFEPFFTDRGVGLGLSITHAIVIDHGGAISVESEGVGHGSRFLVRLPAAMSKPAEVGDAAASA